MSAVWEIIVKLLNEPAVLGVLATIAAMIVVSYSKKKTWIQTYMPVVFDVYNWVEKNFQEYPGRDKIELFMSKFKEDYATMTGKVITTDQLAEVKGAVAMIAYNDDHDKVISADTAADEPK